MRSCKQRSWRCISSSAPCRRSWADGWLYRTVLCLVHTLCQHSRVCMGDLPSSTCACRPPRLAEPHGTPGGRRPQQSSPIRRQSGRQNLPETCHPVSMGLGPSGSAPERASLERARSAHAAITVTPAGDAATGEGAVPCVDSPIGARPCGRASWVGSLGLHGIPSMDRGAEAL
jgi:hypothetical protein